MKRHKVALVGALILLVESAVILFWTTTAESAVGWCLIGALVFGTRPLPSLREATLIERETMPAYGEFALFLAVSFVLAALWTLSRPGSLDGRLVIAGFVALGPVTALVRTAPGPAQRAAAVELLAGTFFAASAAGASPGFDTTGRLVLGASFAGFAGWQLMERSSGSPAPAVSRA